jgi:hypothetical protein
MLEQEIDSVYHSRFIELAEILYELINELGDAYKNVRTMIMTEILQDK